MEYQIYDVDQEYLSKWQNLLDILARLLDVPAALIMRVHSRELEVLLASNSKGNPYKPGEITQLDTGLYCEEVMQSHNQLLVPNALKDAVWQDNPDVSLNMIAYLGQPLFLPNGNIFGTICVLDSKSRSFSDTHQKLLFEFKGIVETDFALNKSYLEEAARAKDISEERFCHMFQHMGSGVAIYEPIDDGNDFIFKGLNAAAEKITHLAKEEAIGNRLLDLFPHMGKSALMTGLQQVYQSGQSVYIPPFYYEDTLRKGWRENRIYKLPTGEIVTIFDDVTHRIELEMELVKNEQKYSSIMEAMKDEVYICSPDCRIEYMNPRMISKIGRYPLGEFCYEAIYKQKERCPWCVFNKDLKGQHIEYELLNPVDKRYYSVSNSPIWSTEDSFSKLTILRDITDEKMTALQLRQAHKMEAIGTLSGGIAHEFNNMLGIILGNAELALDDIPKMTPASDSVEEIRLASLRAKNVVMKLMRIARQTPETRKLIQIKNIVKESLDLLRKTIPTTIAIQQNLLCSTEMILADATEINQILFNLFSNSVYAIGKKTGIIKTTLEAIELSHTSSARHENLTPGKYVKLVVEDSGCGIEPRLMERIYDPYFTTKEIDEGLGMGLAVVFGIIENHDGSIAIESQVGKGTTVEILFPLLEGKTQENKKIAETLPTGTERILCIDDEPSMVKMITRMLESFGYEVVGMTNSLDALGLFTKDPEAFDLILSDMAMPDLAGDLLAEKMLQVNPEIPIVLCTGYSDHINKEKSLASGIMAFVHKPMSKAVLARVIRNVLDAVKSTTHT